MTEDSLCVTWQASNNNKFLFSVAFLSVTTRLRAVILKAPAIQKK